MMLYTYVKRVTPCHCCGQDKPTEEVRPSELGPQCGECRELEFEASL